MANVLGKVSALTLFVQDLGTAKSFYRDVFGVPVVHEDDDSVCVKFDNLLLNLLHENEKSALVGSGADSGAAAVPQFELSIWVEDVDAVCEELRGRGVTLTGPDDKEWGMRVATFTDPFGHLWEIAQPLR